MPSPPEVDSPPPMRKGDAIGYIVGGIMGLFLVVISLLSGHAPHPLTRSISYDDSPMGYASWVGTMLVFAISAILYGGARLKKRLRFEATHRQAPVRQAARDAGWSLLRIVLLLVVWIVTLLVGGPALAVLGHAVILPVGVAGIVLFLGAMMLGGPTWQSGFGWLLIITAGLALWLREHGWVAA